MAHYQQQEYCRKVRESFPEYFTGKRVLDIGSLDINGNNRFLFSGCDYFGLDVGDGPNVDIVSVGHQYTAPDGFFETVISTEVFEHDMFYGDTIKNIIRMLKKGGAFIFTCASTGRPEHGTRRSDGSDAAPLLIQISEEWSDYYKNLTENDIREIEGFNTAFPDGVFEYNSESHDLYFFGVKGGIKETKKYISKPYPETTLHNQYPNDIFVLGAWPDNEDKENDLLDCINRLRAFPGIPILLVSHYAIKPEIQQLVDYYIYDKDNPILLNKDFSKYDVASGRWTTIGNVRVENEMKFHHDYAIWLSMSHAFNFCKYLGKTNVHYLEYDNLIDTFQYRQSFLEKLGDHDAVIYEYTTESSKDTHFDPYMATYIFSAKTDILVKMMAEINTIEEYFVNRPKGWQLERLFLHYLKKYTSDILLSPYVANNNELNTQAVWNRDGIMRDDGTFQIYLGIDSQDNLYIHLISGFHEVKSTKDFLLEIKYNGGVSFHTLKIDQYDLINLGKYKRGYSVKVNYLGNEVFSEFLDKSPELFRMENRVIKSNEDLNTMNKTENTIDVHFVDGPFVEIKGNVNQHYLVKFIDKDTDEIVYQTRIRNNEWARCSRKWFTNWEVEISSDTMTSYRHTFDLTKKRVFIVFESSSLGDTIAWIPYVEEFRKKHNCHVLVSTFQNQLFRSEYPDIEFVDPGVTVHNLYALYRIGCFYTHDSVDFSSHKTDFRKLRLQEYVSDILGLDFEEIRPRIKSIEPMKSDKPYICIANHSTAQSKYWNNPTGWQELVDYVKELGYDVYLLSKEEDGYMGNKNPTGVIKVDGKTLEEIGSIMLGSDGFIGISSGLSWVSWALGVPTILISGQTDKLLEPSSNIMRIINENVCHGCFSRHLFDKGDWNWCPDHKETERQFECSKEIPFSMVRPKIDEMLSI
jgi:autotransporter strand-loop-strand O-heptosyltransferase